MLHSFRLVDHIPYCFHTKNVIFVEVRLGCSSELLFREEVSYSAPHLSVPVQNSVVFVAMTISLLLLSDGLGYS